MATALSPGLESAYGAASPDDESGTYESAEASRHLAWLVNAVKGRQPDTYRYVLLLRFVLLNMMAFSLLGVAYVQGFVTSVFAGDRTNLCFAIFATFLIGLGICAWRVVQTSRELNEVKEFNPLVPSRASLYLAQIRGHSADSRSILASTLRLKLANRISPIRHIASSLVLLGLIGTVIGFIIALSGVDPATASDVHSIAPMVATLIDGMSVALYTTLLGAVLSLWLTVNYHLLASGTIKLYTALIEFGEVNAGS